MIKTVYSFLIATITMALLAISCSDKDNIESLSQTGLLDANGNLVTNSLSYTNSAWFTNDIPIWATNEKVGATIIKTNTDGSTTVYHIVYETNYFLPNLPESPTDYYRLRVPYSGNGNDYATVSYRDMDKLKQLWLDQIKRKGAGDGKVFAIRNRANDRGQWYENMNFQKSHEGRQDYYYFADNGDIYYKGGDKIDKNKEILVKKFVGATIVDYRTVQKRTSQLPKRGLDQIINTGEYTVGGIYKMAIDVNDARERFADASGGALDGVYDFIAARKQVWFWYNGIQEDKGMFIRQFYSTDFIEVLVLNPYANEGNENCMGLDGYYAYYGDYRSGEGEMPVSGFTEENIHYMTDEKLYLGKRPEWIVPLLSHTTTYTDASRWWSYLVMPGEKY